MQFNKTLTSSVSIILQHCPTDVTGLGYLIVDVKYGADGTAYDSQYPRHAFVFIENSTQSGISILRLWPEENKIKFAYFNLCKCENFFFFVILFSFVSYQLYDNQDVAMKSLLKSLALQVLILLLIYEEPSFDLFLSFFFLLNETCTKLTSKMFDQQIRQNPDLLHHFKRSFFLLHSYLIIIKSYMRSRFGHSGRFYDIYNRL